MTSKVLTIIEKDGKAAKDKDPNLSGDELVKLYRAMVWTRVMDERGLALQRQGRIGFYLQTTGQEASHIGSTYALRESDWVFPSYRQLGSMLLRGARMDRDLPHDVAVNVGHRARGARGGQRVVGRRAVFGRAELGSPDVVSGTTTI